jgi:hypothetical protein
MTTAAKAAYGVTLTRNGNTIAELTSIGAPKLSLDTQEVTSHQSSNSYREYIGTLLDGGEVSIEGNFISSDTNGQIGLITDMEAKTLQSFVITFPTSIVATWTFSALVTAFEIGDMAVDGTLTFSATLKISDKPTLAITASNNLTGLTITTVILYPAFAAGTYDYVADSVGNTCTVTPTFAAGTCTITANGSSQTVATGVASSSISLGSDGAMTTITIVVQETGKTAKTYTVRVANEAA